MCALVTRPAAFCLLLSLAGFGIAQEKDKPKPEKPEEKEKQEAIQRHIRNLKSSFTADRIRAAQELAKIGEDAKPAARALCEAAVESNVKVATEALEALEKVWPSLHKNVVIILAEKEPRKRAEAIKDILLLEEDGDAATPVILENLKRHIATSNDFFGADESVAFSIDALKRYAAKSTSFVNALLTAAGPLNSKGNNRALALIALGDLAEENPKSVPQIKKTLLTGMGDRNPKVRVAALKGIANLGKNAKDTATLNAIKRLKLDSEAEVREAATASLDKLQNE